MTKPIIIGLAGPELTAAEKECIQQIQPLGFILFKRNCQNPDQVRALCTTLRPLVPNEFCPILIDQEGGRVSRLDWWSRPAMGFWGQYYSGNEAKISGIVYDIGYSLGQHLKSLGINVNCAPVLDLAFPGASQVIGDRSFGWDPQVVKFLGESYAKGLLDAGVLPVMKHLPGHGRALVDSHQSLPVVHATREELQQSDFIPFTNSSIPMGMTAHILFPELDPENPATLSSTIIQDIIRGDLQFDGFLWSDDLAMGAVKDIVLEQRINQALHAGCDAVLYCDPDLEPLAVIAHNLPLLSRQSFQRFLSTIGLFNP